MYQPRKNPLSESESIHTAPVVKATPPKNPSGVFYPSNEDGLLYNPWKTMVGGSHYLKNPDFQPLRFCLENNLNANQFSIVKYILRHKQKGGIEDIKKVIDFALKEANISYSVEEQNQLILWLRQLIN